MGLFNGQSPKELRKTLGIPKDFTITHMLGVPIKQIPRRYLTVFLEGAVFEARQTRKNLLDAFELGESLLDKHGGLQQEEAPAEESKEASE